MALSMAQIAGHPRLFDCIREQSRFLLQAYDFNPRLGSVFATQQRWLMAHVGLALHFRGVASGRHAGLTMARFLEAVAAHGVASRNTADAFLKEMLKYGVIQMLPSERDRRIHPMEPSQETLDAITNWTVVHLATLDCLDGGGRTAAFAADPRMIVSMEPQIADGLLASEMIRVPQPTFSLFTWLNNGGVIMDWLIAGLGDPSPDSTRVSTGVTSVADMAQWLKLSRTHLSRKLREAELMGSLGWEDQRGHSAMWVSMAFLDEIAVAQSTKLAIIDSAFEQSRLRMRQAPALAAEIPVLESPQ